MFKRILIHGILISFLEIILYVFSLILFSKIINQFHNSSSEDISDGLTILFSIFTFSLLIIIKNIYIEFIKNYLLAINLITIIVFTIFIQNFKLIPLLSILMIFSAIFTLIFRYFIQRIMENYLIKIY